MVDYGDERLPDRFWEKVYPEPMSGCWLWGAYVDRNGYGQWRSATGKTQYPHRSIAELKSGSRDLYVLHSCDTPSCVNPDHLRFGTQADNMQDAIRRGTHVNLSKTHCKCGRELVWGVTRGQRSCKPCKVRYHREYYQRTKK